MSASYFINEKIESGNCCIVRRIKLVLENDSLQGGNCYSTPEQAALHHHQIGDFPITG